MFKWLSVLDVMKVGQLYLGSHRDFGCLCGILIVIFQILVNTKQFQPWDSNYVMSIFLCLLYHGSVLCLRLR